ncbi:MAG: DUF177 domain-containing protein [Gemmatimonadales bacterium]|nr:MAG: DUF177 domain-containing protein [Gemmatimonadales bacterium]
MLDLARLQRTGTLDVSGEISPEDEVWDEVGGRPSRAAEVNLEAHMTPTGQVLVRGMLEGSLRYECRRCLEPVDRSFREKMDLVWSEPDELQDPDDDDGEIRTLGPTVSELDLKEVVREEILLRVPRWALCRSDCAGLCPQCGINRNVETCACTLKESDPRWDALRALSPDERK